MIILTVTIINMGKRFRGDYMSDTYMIIIFHANGEEHIRSKNKAYLDALQNKLKKRGIESYVVKTSGRVN